ncbi:MAG TPA: DNA polymerase III subunit chi [Sphingorhabdus sp.]|jgi:DNA polymerase-3 subunit chi|uniref:DNA polymerase III subunit chi n=1 Tax=Sphingorhabdus sp. TaxID=1902408 RepID=UPI002BAECFD2|nr:DNA polymerase III subunit chi [Sphingorhabdus sp.]HMT42156.1 DNA polymerase III subunit chi [Sphingorhabdus sp.]HMU21989.1 DNA polymerase III subunit chi [Sphingorhabdus sp.]
MQVDFYQLTRDPAEQVIPAIAQKILDDGGRLLVVSGDNSQLEKLSTALWNAKPESFIAHQMVGEGDDSLQPVLLAGEPVATNSARMIALADGEWRDQALGFDRAFYLFPPDKTDNARAAWRALADKPDVERRYWKQDGGKWRQGP